VLQAVLCAVPSRKFNRSRSQRGSRDSTSTTTSKYLFRVLHLKNIFYSTAFLAANVAKHDESRSRARHETLSNQSKSYHRNIRCPHAKSRTSVYIFALQLRRSTTLIMLLLMGSLYVWAAFFIRHNPYRSIRMRQSKRGD